ncbi:MAG: hypothetical protein A2Y61_03985 [Chloroflexi bacterium RBG_13_60_13]|nr:MAG: hypothetical protein A2Y61_03985 [Chloroflexi bacterium RBG_13_60_13]
MFFEFPLTVPADTAEAVPATLEAVLAAGTVIRVDVQFPAGCVGMVHLSIWRADHQVWPVNLDNDIAGEDVVITWPESYDLEDGPYAFTLKGWSPGTTYDHTVTVRFSLLSLEEGQGVREAPGLLQRLAQLLLGRPS